METVYTCENYELNNGVLTVYEPILVGMVKDQDGFKTLITKIKHGYNAIVCPNLFVDENGDKPNFCVYI